jgi:hypothetical protein
LLVDRHLTFWTLTAWESERDMRAYRNSGAHLKAMPKLINWCDEAHAAPLESGRSGTSELARSVQANHRTGSAGSKVHHPSKDHPTKNFPPPRYPSKLETILLPKQSIV